MTTTKEMAKCPGCNAQLDPSPRGRPKIYCSGRCRMRSSRQRLHEEIREAVREHIDRTNVARLGPRR